MGSQFHAVVSLLPRKETRSPLYRGLGGPQDRSGRVGKTPPPTGIRSLLSEASRYTDCAIPTHAGLREIFIFLISPRPGLVPEKVSVNQTDENQK